MKWKKIYSQLILLKNAGIDFQNSMSLATIAFNAKEYEEASKIFETMKPIPMNERIYQECKAYIATFPENLKYFALLGKNDELIKVWESSQKSTLTNEQAQYVFSAYRETHNHKSALDLLREFPDEKYADTWLKEILQENQSNLLADVAVEVIRAKAKKSKWREAIQLIQADKFDKNCKNKMNAVLIPELAASEDLSEQPLQIRTFIGDYLNKIFIQTPWENITSIEYAGAAIEKAEKIVDSLEFYEMIWKTNRIIASDDEKAFARERWLRRKIRQAEYLEETGKVNEAEKVEKEVARTAKSWNINVDRIPRYPFMETVTNIKIPDQQRKMIVSLFNGGYSIDDVVQGFNVERSIVEQIKKEIEQN